MNHEVRFPTVAQIEHVRQLVDVGLFTPTDIARWTGVTLRDVFRIGKAYHNQQ